VHGKWTGGESHSEKFRRGGHLANNEVFMTIVEPQPATLRVNIAERYVQYVAAGQKMVIEPTAFPETKLTGIVQRVARVPSAAREFEAAVAVALDDAPSALMPGMGCEVQFLPYAKTDALTIPIAAVGSDELDSRKSLVALPGKKGKVEKREVTLGKRNDKQVEVLKGLAEGDEILAEFPKDKE
jgi:multidrug efflux pump subunit AcrA (membrane-fusion protein)